MLSLADAAVKASNYFASLPAEISGPSGKTKSPLLDWRTVAQQKTFEFRLALFMSFIEPAVSNLEKGQWGSWEKERLGCNFKAQSSFEACGVPFGNRLYAALHDFNKSDGQNSAQPANYEDKLKKDLLTYLDTKGVDKTLLGSLKQGFGTDDIGVAGNSMQTLHEGWYSLPNFYIERHLYCIVEVREKDAPLNKAMKDFLNTRCGVAVPTYCQRCPDGKFDQNDKLYKQVKIAAGQFIRNCIKGTLTHDDWKD